MYARGDWRFGRASVSAAGSPRRADRGRTRGRASGRAGRQGPQRRSSRRGGGCARRSGGGIPHDSVRGRPASAGCGGEALVTEDSPRRRRVFDGHEHARGAGPESGFSQARVADGDHAVGVDRVGLGGVVHHAVKAPRPGAKGRPVSACPEVGAVGEARITAEIQQ